MNWEKKNVNNYFNYFNQLLNRNIKTLSDIFLGNKTNVEESHL